MTDTAKKKSAPVKKKAATTRRIGSEQAETRALILDITEQLMLDEGYGAVTTRRVAKEADIRPSLVHYYFPTTDDLFLAAFQRVIDAEIEKQDSAFNSEQALKNLWNSYRNKNRTALAMEFMALGNHRKVIKQEIAAYTERTRKRRAEALAKIIDTKAIEPSNCSPAGLSVLLVSVARTLVMEEGLGISCGHKEAKAFVEYWLDRLQENN
ncbi:MAG: TetR/AcrR family transcriptional regulator [Spongiibacteraceae bacterium]